MKRLIPIFLLSAILGIFALADTKIIAHRGFSSAAPENTLSAFRKAVELGADYFELDVHKSKDGALFIIHDPTLDRVSSSGHSGKVADMTMRELRKVRVGYPQRFQDKFKNEKLPTLKQALGTAGNKIRVCVEIKVPDIEEQVLQTIRELKMEEQVIIFAFDYNVLQKMRELDPHIPMLYLRGTVDVETIEKAAAINATAVGAGRATRITKELLSQAHAKGLELWQWTVNDPEEMRHLLDIGIDGIISDYPDKAMELRAARRK